MATAYLPTWFNQQFFKSDGTVAAGCKLYTYESGTTTPKTMWTNQAGTVAHTNPITLDSAGRPPSPLFFGAGEYSLATYTDLIGSGGTLVAPVADNVGGSGVSDFIADLDNSSDAAKGSGLVGFNPTLNYTAATLGWAMKQGAINVLWISAVRTAVSGGTSAAAALMSVYQTFCTQSGGARPLYFPAGTYLFDSSFIVDVSGSVLLGESGQTVFKRMDSAPGPTLTTYAGTHTGMNILQTNFQGRYSGAATTDLYIDGITFDGNKANNVLNADDNFDNCLAILYASRTTIKNVVVKNAKRIGCALSTNADDSIVIASRAYDCDYGGWYCEVSKNIQFQGTHAARCGTIGTLGYGGHCFNDVTGGVINGTDDSCYDGVRIRNRCTDITISGASRLATRYGAFITDENLGNACAFTGSISGTTMTVTAISAGTLAARQVITGGSTLEDTVIVSQLTGSAGSTGTYQVSKSQTVGAGSKTAAKTPSRIAVVGRTISGCGNDSIYAYFAAHVTCSASPIQTDQAYGIHYQNVTVGRVDCDVSGATSKGVFIDAGCSNISEAWTTGTYTPVVTGASTAGAGTYSPQTGRYTKEGNRCSMYAVATYSAHTGTGQARVSLPFTSNASDGTVLSTSVYNTAAYTGTVVAIVAGGQSYAGLWLNNGGTLTAFSVPAGSMTVVVSGEFEMA